MRRERITAFKVVVFIFALLSPSVFSAFSTASVNSEEADFQSNLSSKMITPVIYHPDQMDRDFDGIIDSLEATVMQMIDANESAVVPVIVTLYNPVEERDLNIFSALGGKVTHVYRHVTYGFAGVIPAANVATFASLIGESLVVIEHDAPVHYHLDVSVPLVRARPIVWDTYGYMGSANYSIAIIDTGIDDTHPDVGPYGDLDFSKKMVGWYDATLDMAVTPEDYGEHGTHVAGIAAGTGMANDLQGSGSIETTFTYVLPQAGWGYVDYIDVMNPGVIELNCSWSGKNEVLLRLYDPAGGKVAETSGTWVSAPLILTYNTTDSSYQTGRYKVLVGNLRGSFGNPFSCIETYPYQGLNDGHNLFTGVAPNSKLVGVKVFDNTGSGTTSTVMAGMEWVIQNRMTYNITVASMSLGLQNGAVDSTIDHKADTMVKNGIVTTVSAGNDYPDYTIGSPGTAAYVITVGATNDENGITDYSSNGDPSKNEFSLTKPDVVAPGGTFQVAYGNRIISADSNDVDALYTGYGDRNSDDYQQMGGTSMSTPHAAGLAALTIESLGEWNWTEDEALKVKMLICMTSFETQSGEGTNVPPLNRGEKDSKEGYGRVCADAAIEAATMTYTVGELGSDVLGSAPSDKKVWARKVSLWANNEYRFNLSVPSGADYDLYLYNSSPDVYGQPVILNKSVNAMVGAEESIRYTPTSSDTYYIVVKWVSGDGSFDLQSTTEHDVEVASVTTSLSEAYVGNTVNITVLVKNSGGIPENFNVTAYWENNTIGTQNVTQLGPEANTTLTFNWNTTGVAPCMNYTIKAEAGLVPGENDTSNNLFIDGEVHVKIPGDIDGDGDVDPDDFAVFAGAYGTSPPSNPECDLDRDGDVDPDDFAIFAGNYGKTC